MQGGSPSPQGHAHASALSWQHPPWVRPQPALFQSKGRGWWRRTHSQAGLTQRTGMRGAGTTAQVASLRNWNPPGLTLSPLHTLLHVLSVPLDSPGARTQGVPRLSVSTPGCTSAKTIAVEGWGLPMGTEPRAYADFILSETRQRGLNITKTFRWRHFYTSQNTFSSSLVHT